MIKVAVIGAGIAGLSCAIELERHGITPVIFEKKHRPGSPFPFAPMMLNFIYRPVGDQLKELKKRYNLELNPISELRSLTVKGPSSKYSVTGHLGYSVLRGQDQNSIESQLAGMLKTRIHFQRYVRPEDLLKQFDYLVVADGTSYWASKLNIWQSTFNCWIRGATVLGKFNPQKVQVWMNTNFCKGGFAYLVPLDSQRASLVLIVAYTSHDHLSSFWQQFLQTENLHLHEIENWDIEFETGLVYPHRVGNTFFIGNSGGFVTSWIGVGIFSCIVSGIEAARSISTNSNFDKNIIDYHSIMERNARLRRLWDRLNNRGIDRVIQMMGATPLKQVFYLSNLDMIRTMDPLVHYLLKNNIVEEKPLY